MVAVLRKVNWMKWEYKQITIGFVFDDNGRGKWISSAVDGTEFEGVASILNYYGEQGWEAINFNPVFYEQSSTTRGAFEVSAFMVFLKRPKE
jgi:hypothetical protein